MVIPPPPAEGGGDAGFSMVGIGSEGPPAAPAAGLGVSVPPPPLLSIELILLWRELICVWSCDTVPCKSVIASVSLVVMILTTSPSCRIFCSLGSWRAHSNSSKMESSSSFFSSDICYDSSTVNHSLRFRYKPCLHCTVQVCTKKLPGSLSSLTLSG